MTDLEQAEGDKKRVADARDRAARDLLEAISKVRRLIRMAYGDQREVQRCFGVGAHVYGGPQVRRLAAVVINAGRTRPEVLQGARVKVTSLDKIERLLGLYGEADERYQEAVRVHRNVQRKESRRVALDARGEGYLQAWQRAALLRGIMRPEGLPESLQGEARRFLAVRGGPTLPAP